MKKFRFYSIILILICVTVSVLFYSIIYICDTVCRVRIWFCVLWSYKKIIVKLESLSMLVRTSSASIEFNLANESILCISWYISNSDNYVIIRNLHYTYNTIDLILYYPLYMVMHVSIVSTIDLILSKNCCLLWCSQILYSLAFTHLSRNMFLMKRLWHCDLFVVLKCSYCENH